MKFAVGQKIRIPDDELRAGSRPGVITEVDLKENIISADSNSGCSYFILIEEYEKWLAE